MPCCRPLSSMSVPPENRFHVFGIEVNGNHMKQAQGYGVYPEEIKALQKDYAELWGQVSTVLKQLAAVVEL